MKTLSIDEIIKLKEKTKEFGYELHTHDACGGQSFSLKLVLEEEDKKVFDIIKEFLKEKGYDVEFFGKNKLNFTIK